METNINTNTVVTVATFAISMRAASLIEDLAAAGIKAVMAQPKWTNKKLPPPRVEVWVAVKDVEAAKEVMSNKAIERQVANAQTWAESMRKVRGSVESTYEDGCVRAVSNHEGTTVYVNGVKI